MSNNQKYGNQNTLVIMDNAQPTGRKLYMNFRVNSFWRAKINLHSAAMRLWLYFNCKKENEEFFIRYKNLMLEVGFTDVKKYYDGMNELITMGYLVENSYGVWEFYADSQGAPQELPKRFSSEAQFRVIDAGKARKGDTEPFMVIDADSFWKAREDLRPNAFYLWVYFCHNRSNYKFNVSRVTVQQDTGISLHGYANAWNELVEKGYVVKVNNYFYYFYANKM